MSRHFGMIAASIWASDKFIALQSDTARLAYVYLHTCQHGNSNGCYRLPPQYLGADMDVTRTEAGKILADLESVGLIEYDTSENVVLIRGFFDHNRITNYKHLLGSIQAFEKLPKKSSAAASLSLEIIRSGYEQAMTLQERGQSQIKTESLKAQKYGQTNLNSSSDMLGVLIEFVTAQKRDRSEQFEAAIEALYIPLSEPLCVDLAIHRDRDLNTDTETDTRTDTQTEDRGQRTEDRHKGVGVKMSASAQSTPDPSPRNSASRGSLTGKGKKTGVGAAAKSVLGKA